MTSINDDVTEKFFSLLGSYYGYIKYGDLPELIGVYPRKDSGPGVFKPEHVRTKVVRQTKPFLLSYQKVWN